jgi:hypothetical protein
MNPLKQSQRQTLKKLSCLDLADKVDEIVDWINEPIIIDKEEKDGAERFAEKFKNNPEEIIKWAEDEIEEYKKLIKLLKK